MSVVTKEMLDAAVLLGRNQERERIVALLNQMRRSCPGKFAMTDILELINTDKPESFVWYHEQNNGTQVNVHKLTLEGFTLRQIIQMIEKKTKASK